MINYEEQARLFEAIGKKLSKNMEVYLIGGSAMLFYNAKTATKDIDIVASSKEDFNRLRNALKEMGFYEKPPFINPKYEGVNLEKPVFFELGENRIDLFCKKIICFTLTESMQARATQAHQYGNITIKIISPEDIILLKCVTERAGDRQDAKELIRRYNIKWDVIIEEAEEQSALGQHLFVVFLYDFLEELNDGLKAGIPKEIIKKIRGIGEKAMIKFLKKKKKSGFGMFKRIGPFNKESKLKGQVEKDDAKKLKISQKHTFKYSLILI